ncbi:UPF0481 protein At3g47200-like [Mangifera indica]|uniref:UPF0481 protein At3g47200-like n=1 Tax=Mangifera indica TaxID=29780 RepID=UPI001CFA38E3|nr:UPF0481 protein At3g47200-like [Mangifera indica]
MLELIGREEQSKPSRMPWTHLEEKLNEMPKLTSSSNCCIYRASKRLRQQNEKVYTPQIVSIGPLHHGEPHLEFLEEEKRRYLQEFLERTRLRVEELYYLIRTKEDTLRSCYAEKIKFDSNAFVEIILVDVVFIVELFLRYSLSYLRMREDRIFGQPYLIQDIWYDMWLLENQIPFFILEEIFNLEKVQAFVPDRLRFIELTYEYFKSLQAVNGKLGKFKDPKKAEQVKHFTDFLRICHLPSEEQKENRREERMQRLLSSIIKPKTMKRKVATAPSVMQLHNAGVEFKLSKSNDSFQINFEKGTLEIPPLKLQLETESLFRNLIAFEQRHYSETYINDYAYIIHRLADTPKDIELLVEKDIIENCLPDKGASTVLNNLSSGTSLNPDNFYFSILCEEMENYRGKSYNNWRAILAQNYFSTPWTTLSVVAAAFVILLTVIQAVFSVLQVTNHQNNCS